MLVALVSERGVTQALPIARRDPGGCCDKSRHQRHQVNDFVCQRER